MFKSYTDVRDWLENFIPHTWTRKELGLERISYLLKLLGNPQNKFKSIHIAGTSGKGSTAFYIARLLQYSKLQTPNSKIQKKDNWNLGFGNWKLRPKIGLHISPHLVDIRERMQINGKLIKLTKFIKLIEEIKRTVESMKDSKIGYPSYFEILVASTFLYFAQEKVDWAVVEVGLGGRLDATNVLNPAITVITNVGLDHTDILGKTIEKIAWEKAGIIKTRVPVVTGCSSTHFVHSGSSNFHNSSGSSRKALEVIEKVAKTNNASLITINTQSVKKALKSDVFNNINLPIDTFRSTPYSFAFLNKLLALAAVNVLGISPYNKHYSSSEAKRNREVPRKKSSRQARTVINRVFKLIFPGRFEEIENGVILDGAHNPDKIRSLIDFVQNSKTQTPKPKIIFVVAFKKGKDWKKMVDLLVKNLPVSKVIATKFYAVTDMGKHQAVEPKDIAKYVRSVYRLPTTVYSSSHEAVFPSLTSNSYLTNQLILVTGSLYLVGEVRTMWKLPKF